MATIFKAGQPNFPANQAALDGRLEKIKKLINNAKNAPHINIHFMNESLLLMQDCDLITEYIVEYLSSHFTPEGVFRLVENYDDILDANNYVRFYKGTKRRVELNDKTFLISKEWFPSNKQQFYDWLKKIAQDACEEYWAEQKIVEVPITNASNDSTAPEETPKPDDLKAVLASLEELHKKIDEMNEKITFLYDELK